MSGGNNLLPCSNKDEWQSNNKTIQNQKQEADEMTPKAMPQDEFNYKIQT